MGNEFSHKLVDVPVLVEEAPVELAHFVVLTIRVAVTPAECGAFRHPSAASAYRSTLAAQLLDGSVVGRPFDATVPGQGHSRAVPVSFAIRLVVLVIVRN
jgi:hypothetical protein